MMKSKKEKTMRISFIKDRIRELTKAGALIVAEIERLQRAEITE